MIVRVLWVRPAGAAACLASFALGAASLASDVVSPFGAAFGHVPPAPGPAPASDPVLAPLPPCGPAPGAGDGGGCFGPPASSAAAPPPSPIQAGYDNGFYIRGEDGRFRLAIRGLIQYRYIGAFRDTSPGATDAEETGFVLQRTPVLFSGDVLRPQLRYFCILAASPSEGSEFVEECKIIYEFQSGLLLQAGRLRNPAFLRELDVSYTRQLGVERSYLHSVFSTGVLEGLVASRQREQLRWTAFFSDGRGSGSSSQTKDFFQDKTDFAVTTAIDYRAFGEWAQYGDFASWSDEGPALFLGAAVHYEKGETGDTVPANDLNDFLSWTCDVTYENAGLTLFGAVVGRHSLHEGRAIDQHGVLLQAGCQVAPDELEPFVRYEYIDFDGVTNVGAGGVAVGDSSLNLVSAGFNYYFDRHGLKFTAEAVHALDNIPFTAAATGLLQDDPGEDGQTVVRTQLQLFF